MRVLSVVGARPQFVKLAPVAQELALQGHEHVIVHTGQHYDAAMSDVFFHDLSIAPPDVNLEVGSAGHGEQTGAMLAAMDDVLESRRPDWVVVYGDTNSTLAGALSAVKLHFPVAHVEAGLRSFNRRMPEEHNRVLTDHAADLLLAPTAAAMDCLAAEGLAKRAILVGDVMADVLFRTRDGLGAAPAADLFHLRCEEPYLVATLHRPANVDEPQRLSLLVDALASLDTTVLLAAHPRLVAQAQRHGIKLDRENLHTVPPMTYLELVAAVISSTGVITDSGGLQKEAFLLGQPCTTLRSETEWPETLTGNWNVLVNEPSDLRTAVCRPMPTSPRGQPFGDGAAARAVVAALAGA